MHGPPRRRRARDVEAWLEEPPEIRKHHEKFGASLPQGLKDELDQLEKRLVRAGAKVRRAFTRRTRSPGRRETAGAFACETGGAPPPARTREPMGTRERKRSERAAPDPVQSRDMERASIGCAAFLCLGLGGVLGTVTRSAWPLGIAAALFALFALPVVWAGVRRHLLLSRAGREWGPRWIECLVVTSDSLHWREHVESHWLARLGSRAVVLNWSRRDEWGDTLEARLFEAFVRAARNFAPCVLVLRDTREPAVYRFFEAFREERAGRPQYRRELETQLFRELRLAPEPPLGS